MTMKFLDKLRGSEGPWRHGRVVAKPSDPAYGHAKLAVDKMVGLAKAETRAWRAGCAIACVAAVGSSAGWFLQARQATIEPVAITFDQAGRAGEVFIPRDFTPSEAMKIAFLDQWMKAAIAKTGNASVDKERREFLRWATAGEAGNKYAQWWKEIAEHTNGLQSKVVSIKPTADSMVLNVVWDERSSETAPWLRFAGDFTLAYKRQTSREEMYLNKYGLYVINYTRVPVNEVVSR